MKNPAPYSISASSGKPESRRIESSRRRMPRSDSGRLNERMTNVFFCGSYFRYGFHEDAFTSALNLSRLLAPGVWA